LSNRSYCAPLLVGVLSGNKELRRNAWAVGFSLWQKLIPI